jgi:hypothetical protein
MTNAFIHRPKGNLSGVYFHPTATRMLWNLVWDEARKQDWFTPDVGYIGNDGKGNFYFQLSGVTTGFAKVHVG